MYAVEIISKKLLHRSLQNHYYTGVQINV